MSQPESKFFSIVRVHGIGKVRDKCLRFCLPPDVFRHLTADGNRTLMYFITEDESSLQYTSLAANPENKAGHMTISAEDNARRLTIPRLFCELHALRSGDYIALEYDMQKKTLLLKPHRACFTALEHIVRIREIADGFYYYDPDRRRRINKILTSLEAELDEMPNKPTN